MPQQIPKIAKVVEDDMCIACGACLYACPEQVVTSHYSQVRGAYEVKIVEPSKCADCWQPCDQVCPSIEVNFVNLLNNKNTIDRTGNIESIYLGYSLTHRYNRTSSSGGIIRAFIYDAITRGQPVICLGQIEEKYQPIVLTALQDLEKIPGSIYHGVSFTKCIKLLQEIKQPCLLIATPCQLEGIYKYISQIEPTLRQKIAVTVGLICGWMYSDHALQAFASYKNIPGTIIDARYRGEDKVGLLKIKTETKEYKYNRRIFANIKESLDYKASFASPMNRLRCRVCENHINLLADIAVGDAWLSRKKSEKLSIIITRTKLGEQALSSLASQGDLVLEQGLDSDINESQSPNLVYGYVARKLNIYLQNHQVITPKFIFTDYLAPKAVGLLSLLEFNWEMSMRKIIRRSDYKKYRQAYFSKNLLKFLKNWLKLQITSSEKK